jgi:hypothetical protein
MAEGNPKPWKRGIWEFSNEASFVIKNRYNFSSRLSLDGILLSICSVLSKLKKLPPLAEDSNFNPW